MEPRGTVVLPNRAQAPRRVFLVPGREFSLLGVLCGEYLTAEVLFWSFAGYLTTAHMLTSALTFLLDHEDGLRRVYWVLNHLWATRVVTSGTKPTRCSNALNANSVIGRRHASTPLISASYETASSQRPIRVPPFEHARCRSHLRAGLIASENLRNSSPVSVQAAILRTCSAFPLERGRFNSAVRRHLNRSAADAQVRVLSGRAPASPMAKLASA